MKLVDKSKSWDSLRTFKGRKKKYEVTVYYSASSIRSEVPYWYYTLDKDDEDYRYNSLWENSKYTSQEECVDACEKKIEELTNGK